MSLKTFQSPQIARDRLSYKQTPGGLGGAFQHRTASWVQQPPRLGLHHSLAGMQGRMPIQGSNATHVCHGAGSCLPFLF